MNLILQWGELLNLPEDITEDFRENDIEIGFKEWLGILWCKMGDKCVHLLAQVHSLEGRERTSFLCVFSP